MESPSFRVINTESGMGVTYACGCDCTPTASPANDGPGFEHCCCGKVHFVGTGAEEALTAYLAERKAKRRREPEYTRGTGSIAFNGESAEVAWAFPVE